MRAATPSSALLRALLKANRPAMQQVLGRYGASNLKVFGSVARGDARPDSDVDLLVDLEAGDGNELLRVAGLGEELSRLLQVKVDVVSDSLLREPVSAQAHRDAINL